jgi:DNA invertase Pin-like site-specific DNA recombinase
MRRIGYARCSSQGQNLDRQIAALRAERCDVIFREKVSGRSMKNRPELEKPIDQLGTGDTLVVAEWDRATRSMLDGVHLIERINTRGALIKVLDKPHLDLTTQHECGQHAATLRGELRQDAGEEHRHLRIAEIADQAMTECLAQR